MEICGDLNGYKKRVNKDVIGAYGIRDRREIVLVVDNVRAWLYNDYTLNKNEYSLMDLWRILFQKKDYLTTNEGIYYKYSKIEGEAIKYDIIAKDDFIKALTSWDNLLIPTMFSGPVIKLKTNSELTSSIEYSRKQILITSLLTLGDDEKTITGLHQKIYNFGLVSSNKELTSIENSYIGTIYDKYLGDLCRFDSNNNIVDIDEMRLTNNIIELPSGMILEILKHYPIYELNTLITDTISDYIEKRSITIDNYSKVKKLQA